MNNKKVLVTLCDEGYLEMAKALFSSAHLKGGWDGDYLLLAHQIPEDKLKWFKDKGIEVWQCQPLSDMYHANWKPAIMSKFYVFDKRIKKWDNVVYLDADCIVRADIRKLGKVKGFKARKVMMTFGRFEPVLRFTPKNHFNTGVLAFSTDIIKDQTFEDLKKLISPTVESIKNKEHLILTDEIILSKYFKKIWKNFPLSYHVIPEQIEDYCFVDYKKVQGIIFHHIYGLGRCPKPWVTQSYFYPEWKKNLDKVDNIDFRKSFSSISTWPFWKVYFYYFYYSLNKLFYPTSLLVHKVIGNFGLIIKEINPKIYNFLRKILKNEK